MVESDNNFGLKLFKEVVLEEEMDKNIFISPLSVSMALGMTYNGADGSTEEAMQTTLELSNLTLEKVNESYKSLIELLTGLDPKVEFNIANSIWYRENWSFEEEFLDRCSTYFDAEVSGLDFADPGAADIINGWVDENTNGKITEIVDSPIDPYTVIFLINAIGISYSLKFPNFFDPGKQSKDSPCMDKQDFFVLSKSSLLHLLH